MDRWTDGSKGASRSGEGLEDSDPKEGIYLLATALTHS